MLPSQNGVNPHVTGNYGESRSGGPHGGTDFNYVGGQTGTNLTHPTINAPIDGTVTFVGGQYGTIKIRDADGNSHEILHTNSQNVSVGDQVSAGNAIGTMGGKGPNGANQYAQHVHYQMKDPQGRRISPQEWWDNHDSGTDDGAGGAGNGEGAPGGPGSAGGAAGRAAAFRRAATLWCSTSMVTAWKPPARAMARSSCSTMMATESRPAPAGSSPTTAGWCWTAMATAPSIPAASYSASIPASRMGNWPRTVSMRSRIWMPTAITRSMARTPFSPICASGAT
ncbi:M23 family metallopeptidase [Chitinimonas arctica]|nr:M23 family metallopeptidase [Chitinimonas arctica]